MIPSVKHWSLRTARAVVAGALVLGAAACEKPSSEKAAKDAGRVADQVNRQAGAAVNKADTSSSQGQKSDAEKAAEKENAALAAKVKSALAADKGLKIFAIDISASGGGVTLFGTVDSSANRDKAARLASSVDGVKSVTNKLVLVSGS